MSEVAPKVLAGRYRTLRPLGAGAHGTVELAEDLLNGGRLVAVKRIEGLVGAGKGTGGGSPLFMAPELTEAGGHDHRVDLYSLGLVAFRVATGRDPFTGGAGEILGRRRREAAPGVRTIRPELSPALEGVIA